MATALVACRLEGMGGEVFQETLARRFRVLTRPVRELEATRFSCAFFNTEEEIDQAIEAVKTLALETVA
jgi:selenocysteine lyase/cysteine desulfurase